jgi:hypothetical protein
MTKMIDLTGQHFGRLHVLYKFAFMRKTTFWQCKCACGNFHVVATQPLRKGWSKSCGCLKRETAAKRQFKHGGCGSRLYWSWQHMIGRCHDPKSAGYLYYGARGIKVCKRWHNFANFRQDMGRRPRGKWLERVDNNGNYCKENCIWDTPKNQNRNKRNIKVTLLRAVSILNANSKGYSTSELARLHPDLGYNHIWNILKGRLWADAADYADPYNAWKLIELIGHILHELTVKYKVTTAPLWAAITGKSWSHINGAVPKRGRGFRTPERIPRGSANHNSKLDEKTVKKIKQLLPTTKGVILARMFNTTIHTISAIKRGKVWNHIHA